MSDPKGLEVRIADDEARRLAAVWALIILGSSMVLVGVGVGWWIHPGAGLAVFGLLGFVIGIFIGRE